MIRISIQCALLACSFMGSCALAYGQGTKPNIVVIVADDLGNADLGYRGSDISTPNIDQLAKGGVRAESFCGMPGCYTSTGGTHDRSLWLADTRHISRHAYGLPTDDPFPQALKVSVVR